MPLALILSSHVAASRVGGSAQALALAQFKIDSIVVPTVLYGRHPGWGPPGGAPVPNWKPGDWMCGGCNTHNFASRAACFRCGAAKEGGGAPGQGPP